jgi:GNAT superfamily N-acetyltransferase
MGEGTHVSGSDIEIRALDPDRDATDVVELIHEVFPATTTTVESWRQQLTSIPERARHASWAAVVGGTVVGRAEATLGWFSGSGTAWAGVSVRKSFRRRGIGGRLWDLAAAHLDELAPSRVLTMFTEDPAAVRFARARGFEEARAESLSCVDPRTIDLSPLASAEVELVPLGDLDPREVYEVDVATTSDVPTTDELTDIRYEEWLDTIWRRPTITLEGSFAALDDGRVVCITMLAANLEIGRAFNEYTGTLRSHRGRGFALLVKLASLRWASANGITAVWTTNDETNAPMLAVNRRLGYEPRLRRVEYIRE